MIRVIIIAFLFLSNLLLLAQNNQQGMVKMKGRLNQSGTIITGTGVPNALVSIKGNNPFKTTSKGLFSFPVKGNYFYILSVKKDGLQLLDPDIISRSNPYTPNSIIYITLEEPSSRVEDKLAAERKIRKKLRKQLEEKEDSIEYLKRINSISTQQYNELLASLYREEEENEKLITSMAERYASIDFDLLDDFNKNISECILNGDLTKADSLLQTKGSMDKRIAHINKLKRQI